MKRHSALHKLSHDHHHGLILAQLIKKDAPEYKNLPRSIEGKRDYAIRFYEINLVKHFTDEEEILFPFVKSKNRDTDVLLADLIKEHRAIENYIHKLQQKENVELSLGKLGNILESHIRKEERILFPKIQEVFSEKELGKIGDRLSDSG